MNLFRSFVLNQLRIFKFVMATFGHDFSHHYFLPKIMLGFDLSDLHEPVNQL